MVSKTLNNGTSEEKAPEGVPEGRYRLVGWDVDTTGRRLIDEICQIAAYTPNSQFAQHIMPYADLNPNAQRRHNIRVVTINRYRLLKDLKTNKFLRTKSEISALIDFLNWLEETKGDATDGIILMYHEVRNMSPARLLEALRRYNLLERFTAVVKGFANSYSLTEAKCGQTVKSFSLRVLSKVLLDKEENLDNAVDRARICYHVVQHLGQGERQDLEGEGSGDGVEQRHTIDLIRQYTKTIDDVEKDLSDLKILLERQNTFRPVFKELMQSNWVNRQHASRLRRLLAENNLDYNQLNTTFEDGGREALEEKLKKYVPDIKPEDFTELLEILDCYFDPEKKPVQPKPLPQRTSKPAKVKSPKVKVNSGSEMSGNAYSDVGSPESDDTPRNDAEVDADPDVAVAVPVQA